MISFLHRTHVRYIILITTLLFAFGTFIYTFKHQARKTKNIFAVLFDSDLESNKKLMNSQNDNFELRPWGMEVPQFCMLMHLAQFAGYLIPFVGIVLPLVMWLTHKDQSRIIDLHGKEIVNWMISSFIYFIVGFILTCFVVGIPIIIAVAICSIIFPILGAVKATEGIVFKYPLTIRFIL